ncbi:MAG: sugar phosphate nucleotidyltransferase [Candidatus Omnitrophota bacterium]|nr:sugar phosphate nucleotidyltransferase [Candidatus Omnitrophota bacterium]
MTKNIRTIILAAGAGTRMKSGLPKVLHTINSKPLLQFVLDNVKALGLKDVYVVVGFRKDLIKNYIGKNAKTLDQKKLAGTADALKAALSKIKNFSGLVLVLYGDNPLIEKASLENLIKTHLDSKVDCTLLTATLNNPFGYGRIIRDNYSRIRRISEEVEATSSEKQVREINVGAYCFNPKVLPKALQQIKSNNKKKEFYLTDIIEAMAEMGCGIESAEVKGEGEVLGINTRQDLAAAAKIIRSRILRDFMLNGVTIVDPENTYIESNVKIGQDTVIYPYTYIENDVIIGANCAIGPFCHIRQSVFVKDNVTLGNFVEVSRAKVGKGVFVKHFSFLGDVNIGDRVNIGAGVVTANFDGVNKNLIQISDDAFIGSDTVLVAPVKIGKKAITGAGSVVTRKHNVPDRGIVVGVPAKILKRSK